MGKCNICGWVGTKWTMCGGPTNRRAGHCPQCHSGERQRAMMYVMRNHKIYPKPPRDPWTVLSISIDRSWVDDLRQSYFLQVIDIKGNNPGVGGVRAADVRSLPYTSKSIDMVLQAHVLEHLAPGDDVKAVQEISRVLRPSGIYISTMPSSAGPVNTPLKGPGKSPDGHWRLYGYKDYCRLLSECGFIGIIAENMPKNDENLGNDPVYLCDKEF